MTIQLHNLRFAYPGVPDKTVLDIQEWSVAPQEQVFVHGSSGCGKSTLLNLLSGILPTISGEISVLGERLDQMNGRQRDVFRANHIGYIFQQFNLIPYLDAVDNIRLATRFSKKCRNTVTRKGIEALLQSFHLDQSQWYKPIETLSVGQQQRIAIARAMVNKPEVLIADEPTSSLDKQNRDNFMVELKAMMQEHKTTLIFVSHDMALADYFGRVDALSEINSASDVRGAHNLASEEASC